MGAQVWLNIWFEWQHPEKLWVPSPVSPFKTREIQTMSSDLPKVIRQASACGSGDWGSGRGTAPT